MFKKNLFTLVLFSIFLSSFVSQIKGQTLFCKKNALISLRSIPSLKYKCRANVDDYDEKILKFPERIVAINNYKNALEKFIYPDWWKTSVEDLNVCDYRKKSGVLNEVEKSQFEGGNYIFKLFGNNQFRAVIVSDPCYQTGFGGSNVFLLHWENGKVFVSQALDGFFSRADNPIFVNFAVSGNEQIIELETTSGGLNPTVTNYYFTIDPKTNRAIPKNLFLDDDGKPTYQITSNMLLEESENYGLPPNLDALQIIKNNRLAKSFDVFEDTGEVFGEDNHRKFSRTIFEWNGKFYRAKH